MAEGRVNHSATISNEIGLNAEQTQAIQFIVKGQYSPLPYLLYGPPGKNFIFSSFQLRFAEK